MQVDRLELDTVRELVDVAGKRVLEMGCGDGRFTFEVVPERTRRAEKRRHDTAD